MYECKRTTSDNLVEAVKTVGTEEDVAFEYVGVEVRMTEEFRGAESSNLGR